MVCVNPVDDQVIFGATATASVHAFVFELSARFLDGFAWASKQVSGTYAMTTRDTYVGYTGAGLQTITLPPVTTSAVGVGLKPGSIVIVHDETGLDLANQIAVAGAGGALIDGVSPRGLSQGGSFFLMTDGTNWTRIVGV
jgi:hypothetical protein